VVDHCVGVSFRADQHEAVGAIGLGTEVGLEVESASCGAVDGSGIPFTAWGFGERTIRPVTSFSVSCLPRALQTGQ